MKEFWENFFKFVRELLPAIATFMMGKRVGEIGKEELRAKRDALALELERVKNSEAVDKANSGLSDDSIIDNAIKSGLGKISKSD